MTRQESYHFISIKRDNYLRFFTSLLESFFLTLLQNYKLTITTITEDELSSPIEYNTPRPPKKKAPSKKGSMGFAMPIRNIQTPTNEPHQLSKGKGRQSIPVSSHAVAEDRVPDADFASDAEIATTHADRIRSQPLICCPEVEFDREHRAVLPGDQRRLLDSFIAQIKSSPQNPNSEFPHWKPPENALSNFQYAIIVTTRMPATVQRPYPPLQLIPEKPWRWFVWVDKDTDEEGEIQSGLQVPQKRNTSEQLVPNLSLKNSQRVEKTSTRSTGGSLGSTKSEIQVLPKKFMIHFHPISTSNKHQMHEYGVKNDYEHKAKRLKLRPDEMLGREISVPFKTPPAALVCQWVEVESEHIPDTFHPARKRPDPAHRRYKLICETTGHEHIYGLRVLENSKKQKRKQFFPRFRSVARSNTKLTMKDAVVDQKTVPRSKKAAGHTEALDGACENSSTGDGETTEEEDWENPLPDTDVAMEDTEVAEKITDREETVDSELTELSGDIEDVEGIGFQKDVKDQHVLEDTEDKEDVLNLEDLQALKNGDVMEDMEDVGDLEDVEDMEDMNVDDSGAYEAGGSDSDLMSDSS